MRRFISYIALSSALILGAALGTVPTIINMDGDLGYADGQTMYFRAATYDEASENGNYAADENGQYTFIDNSLYIADSSQKAPIEYIAETMRGRLDNWGISGYKVETKGDSTVAVSFRSNNNSSTMNNYIQRILTFNGGDFSFDASDTSYDDYAYDEKWSSLIDGQTARIEDIDMQGYKVPVVVVPLHSGDDYKTSFLNLINYCVNHTTVPADTDPDKEQTETKYTNLVVWANRSTLAPESYEEAAQNPNVANKIVMVQATLNGNAVWYDSNDKDKETPSLQLVPVSKATEGGSYDPSYTQEAYDAARYTLALLNSNAYEYDAFKNSAGNNKFCLTYTYSERADASVENLLLKNWNIEPAMSRTLICVLAVVLALCLILIIFERWLALIEIAAFLMTGFASFAAFVAFGAQFNIAALIGLAATVLIALFGALFYSSRLRDELYKGRTLKKAHSEASKRSTWPILDAGIVSALIGVFTYVLGGDIASKAGVMLVLGGVFGTVFNLAMTRLAGWMLCNDSTMATRFPQYLRVDKEKIPDLLKEEKQSYFGPYAGRDFTRGKKVAMAVSCLFLLAGTGAMIGWGVANNGNFFNSTAYEQSSTVLQLEVKSEKLDVISVERLSSVSYIYDSLNQDNHDALLNNYQIDGVTLGKMVKEVNLSSTPHQVVVGTDVDDLSREYWFYYEVELDRKLDTSASANYAIKYYDGSAFVDTGVNNLVDMSEFIKARTVGESSDNLIVDFANVKPEALTPYFYQVALGLGVGLAVGMVYMVIRYRPSRGLAVGVLAGAAGFSSVSFFALTRISTTPVVSLGAVLVIVGFLLAALYALAGEKEVFRESREKEKDTFEMRSSFLKESVSRNAGTIFLFLILMAYVAIIPLFGPSAYLSPYLVAILGIALTVLSVVSLLQPSSAMLAKGFSRFSFSPSLPKRKKKAAAKNKGGDLMKRKKGAEPEEAIFIGIND